METTVNSASKLDRYPIPKIEDLFAKLAGGKLFSKLDMSQAYQQIPLEEDSKQYVVPTKVYFVTIDSHLE